MGANVSRKFIIDNSVAFLLKRMVLIRPHLTMQTAEGVLTIELEKYVVRLDEIDDSN